MRPIHLAIRPALPFARSPLRRPLVPALAALVASCAWILIACGRDSGGSVAQVRCDDPEVARLVQELGGRLQTVSLLASDSALDREIRSAYGELATPALLDRWLTGAARAPGRTVSSPWPDRIEVDSARASLDGGCRVDGRVAYATSADSPGGDPALREPITLTVVNEGGWRIDDVELAGSAGAASDSAPEPGLDPTGAAGPNSAGAAPAVAVLSEYYAAISARDFRRAYSLWSDGGRASLTSYETFAAGFADTDSARVEPGQPGRIEGAAGSRYVEIPVVVRAWTRGGETQRFEGVYVLRRSVVDGATQDQRAWRIASARIGRAR